MVCFYNFRIPETSLAKLLSSWPRKLVGPYVPILMGRVLAAARASFLVMVCDRVYRQSLAVSFSSLMSIAVFELPVILEPNGYAAIADA